MTKKATCYPEQVAFLVTTINSKTLAPIGDKRVVSRLLRNCRNLAIESTKYVIIKFRSNICFVLLAPIVNKIIVITYCNSALNYALRIIK